MILFLILIAVFGLTILGCAPIAILGLVRKNKKMMYSGVIGFFIGLVGISALTIIYSESAYNYVNGVADTANLKSENNFLSKGLSETIHDERVAGLSGMAKDIFGRSIKAVVNTGDSVLGDRNIFLDESIDNAGIKPEKAGENIGTFNSLSVDMTFDKDFTGRLVLAGYNQEGSKRCETVVPLQKNAGESSIVKFKIKDSQTDLKVYYVLSAEK